MGGHYYSFTLDTQTRGELSGLTCIRNVSRPASVFAYVLSNQVISWLTKNEARSLTGWLQHPTASAQQITNYTPCLKKNAPTLESCSLNRHGLILIFFIKNSINTLLKIICIFNFGRMIGSYVARRLHAFYHSRSDSVTTTKSNFICSRQALKYFNIIDMDINYTAAGCQGSYTPINAGRL